VRIGVNGGSLNQELVDAQDAGRTLTKTWAKSPKEIINDCMVLSALQSTELAFGVWAAA